MRGERGGVGAGVSGKGEEGGAACRVPLLRRTLVGII